MKRATFSERKYIFYHQFSKFANLAWSFNLFILFYSIGKGAEAFCHLGTQRSMHMETELSSALLSHPVTTVHFYYPEYAPVSTAQHTKHTHLCAQLRTYVQITFLVNQNICNGITMLVCESMIIQSQKYTWFSRRLFTASSVLKILAGSTAAKQKNWPR